jgi:enediyne biosynthesis protein E4
MPSRLSHVSTDRLGWGTLFLDLDHDGWLDLFVTNGHVFDDVESFGIGSTFRQPSQVLRNLGDGRFADASADFGPDVLVHRSGRGLAAGDLEGDGDLDLLIVQLNAIPALLRNDGGSRGAWLVVASGEAVMRRG